MIRFRKEHAIVRKFTKASSCGFPDISIHNGYPWNGGTEYSSRQIGIMYAGRNEEDTKDDIVFYGMNAYWTPLDMQLPSLPDGVHWKICVNTFVEYADGKDIGAETEFHYGSRLKIPPRSVIVLVAE